MFGFIRGHRVTYEEFDKPVGTWEELLLVVQRLRHKVPVLQPTTDNHGSLCVSEMLWLRDELGALTLQGSPMSLCTENEPLKGVGQ